MSPLIASGPSGGLGGTRDNRRGEKEEQKEETADTDSSTTRASIRPKRKPDRYGHNIIISAVAATPTKQKEPECCKRNASRIEKREQIRKEIEQLPDFTKMTESEVEAWIHE